jgi:predicted component of type VI protein secretion system
MKFLQIALLCCLVFCCIGESVRHQNKHHNRKKRLTLLNSHSTNTKAEGDEESIEKIKGTLS